MQKSVKAVIGSNWGDEGKGNITNYFSSPRTTVCRFNGGAQAGHTVELADGRRYVFHHFGSGSLRGAETYLSRFFISNPMVYCEELKNLHRLGCKPRVTVDPRGLLTTPFDMMINQMVEEKRGAFRHGSCGLGINETIERSQSAEFLLTTGEIDTASTLKAKLSYIKREWVPQRLTALGLAPSTAWEAILDSEDIIDHFASDAVEFHHHVNHSTDHLSRCEDIVFEGAQGLLLDEDHYFFPNVTRSHTGLKNVMALAEENGLRTVDVTYVTRAYATRHGAGPFPCEDKNLGYVDRTNVPNDWQGNLRFGYLNIDLLAESVANDVQHASIPVSYGVAVTCLDQVGPRVQFLEKGSIQEADTAIMVERILARTDAYWGDLLSYGPAAGDVRVYTD